MTKKKEGSKVGKKEKKTAPGRLTEVVGSSAGRCVDQHASVGHWATIEHRLKVMTELQNSSVATLPHKNKRAAAAYGEGKKTSRNHPEGNQSQNQHQNLAGGSAGSMEF